MELSIIVCGKDNSRSTVLCGDVDTAGYIPTYFSSSFFIYSFSGCFINTYLEPSFEAGALSVTKQKLKSLPP